MFIPGENSKRKDSFETYRKIFTALLIVAPFFLLIAVVIGIKGGLFHYSSISALFESIKNVLFSTIFIIGSIIISIIIILFICYINSNIESVIVFPFESMDSNIDGNAIADNLIMKMKKMKDIHDKPLEISPSERLPLAYQEAYTESMPNGFNNFNDESALFSNALAGLGKIDIGLLSLPIGHLLIGLHRFRPIGKSGCIIQGSVQKYNNDLYIVSHIRTKNYSFIREIEGQSLHEMVKDLAFEIVHKMYRCNKIEIAARNNLKD